VNGKVPGWHWDEEENRLRFLGYVRRKMEIQEPKDWHRVRRSDVARLGGGGLVSRYPSLLSCIAEAYPEVLEEENRAEVSAKKRKGFWLRRASRKQFLLDVKESLGVRCAEDWAHVTREQLTKAGGRGALQHYRTVADLVADSLPEEGERLRRRLANAPPKRDWREKEKRRAFLESVAKECGVALPEEWHRLRSEELARAGGAGLLQRYGNNRRRLFLSMYEERDLGESLTLGQRVSRGYWGVPENRRKFLDLVKESRGIVEKAEWARVSAKDIQDMGGIGLLAFYDGSVWRALCDVYSEEGEWELHECRPSVTQGYWDSEESVRAFIRSAEDALGIERPQEWYRVSFDQVRQLPRGASLLQRYTLFQALALTYPDERWDEDALVSVGKRAAQRHMRQRLADIFLGKELRCRLLA